jgi:predicted NAD/FAD-binding protein
MRIAVIGAGITGLGAAHALTGLGHAVTVFEAASRAGGHAHTVDVEVDGRDVTVDTGFLVFNRRTYPRLVALFEALDVPVASSDMSFAVSVGPHRFEWCGSSLRSLFAQGRNCLSPRFWRMLADIARFNRQATALAREAPDGEDALREPLGRFLEREGYGEGFRDDYLLPMAAAIWSCPMRTMRSFPLGTFVRFFHNHGLLTIDDRPQWLTVQGGSREYVRRITERLDDLRVGTPVHRVSRRTLVAGTGVRVDSRAGTEHFDEVVFACHSDQALALLEDPTAAEQSVLGAIRYQPNRAWLHTDVRLMPKRRAAWAAWNYLSDGDREAPAVSVSYWLNRLQPLPTATPIVLSLNPLAPPDPGTVLGTYDYAHPVFDLGAIDAQKRLDALQGLRRTWYAGAWAGYGFHEDGLRAGQDVATALHARAALKAAA